MAHQIDSLDITGMKKADFEQLEEIFNHVMMEDIRWDRLDYWNARNNRLVDWFDKARVALSDAKIKGK